MKRVEPLRDVAGNPGGQGSTVPGRNKISVRDARAYVAGVGTSGSLLAGAAVLFLIGSAIVAFGGWPQIGAGPATSSISAAPLAARTRASQRLTAAIAATQRPALTHAGAAGAHHSGTRRRTAVEGVRTGSVQAGSTGSAQTASGTTGASTAAAAASQCGDCAGQASSQRFVSTGPGKVVKTVSSVGSDVVKTVSSVGSEVGQQITSLTGAVGQQVGAANQQAGNAVSSAGSTVGSTVTGTVTTATNAVNGLTGGLGLGH